ncbi:MAG: SRPBCC family protein [Chloroflexi bacterium]|nr:SRPBCC family protein [Chloroflexota bacterium]MDA1173540.1 SRPBCC family protein [Chloroflexota bacterium]
MDFHYTYAVNAPADKLWEIVKDIPTVGTCIPGATDIKEGDDGAYTGTVKVRVGPIGLGLNGKLSIDSQDADARTIEFTGEGADRKVPGNVRVKISMAVSGEGETSELVVDSEANVMGKLGEFGQGIIKRKADGIMKDFGKNLTKLVEGI